MPVTASLGGVAAIAMHSDHSCALLSNGTIKCWGENLYGELGVSVTSMTKSADPVYVPTITTATAIAVGWNQSCALLANQTVWCWGSQNHGLLGNGTSDENIVSPTPVQAVGINTAAAIACGGLNCCALLANGTLKCWGYNTFGQVGDGTTVDRSTPVQVLTGLGSPLTNVVDVAIGGYHSCALNASNDVYCWGQSTNLANGATGTSSNLMYATRM
jgi:alpha-tubulin suppressor-like RCC1 family protein